MKKVIILGAGITGLDIGWQLIKKGFDVTILDKQKFVGGLATTLNEGEYKIDIGPHYIALPNDSVRIKELQELIGKEELKEIKVSVKVWFYGKIIDQYPTLFDVMFRYGLKFSILSILSFLSAKIKNSFIRRKFELVEEYCVNTYGKFLYNIWFKPRLIRKFGNIEKISIEDTEDMFPEISSKKLLSFMKKRQSHISVDVDYSKGSYDFYCKNGVGVLAQKFKKEIEDKGGKILLDTNILSINHSESEKSIIIKNGEERTLTTDIIVYAIPPAKVLTWFNPIPEKIKTMHKKTDAANSIMVFLFVDSKKLYDGWIMDIFDSSLVFFRIAQQNYLTDSVSPSGKTLLSVEIRTTDKDPIWKTDESILVNMIKRDLKKMGILNKEKIDGYKLMKIPKVYPILDPSSNPKSIIEFINSFKNEYTLGTLIADPGTLVTSKRKGEKAKNNPIGLTAVLLKTPELVEKIIDENKL